MIELDDQPKPVPRPFKGPKIPLGQVYVSELEGRIPTSQLAGEKKVVLTTAGGCRELITLAEASGIGNIPGTYLNGVDFESFAEKLDEAKLRLYGWGDRWRKIKSAKGVALLLSTLLGIVVALFGAFLAIGGESGTSTGAIAERAQTLLRWTTEPAAAEAPNAAEIRRREAQAQQCLTHLRGGEASVSKVAGVSCTTSTPSFLKDKDSGALLAALAGAVTALLGGIGMADKFRFGQEPS